LTQCWREHITNIKKPEGR